VNYRETEGTSFNSAYESLFADDDNRMHAQRLAAYRKYWLAYLSRHWSYSRGEGDSLLTLNYCRRLVDLHVDFTFSKGFKCSIPDIPGTPVNEKTEREFIRVMLEEAWRKNSMLLWGLEAGQMGGVTGDVFVRVSWDKEHPIEDPYPRADILPSHMCFPEFEGPHGPDRKKIKRILIMNPVYIDSTDLKVSAGKYFSSANKSKPRQQLIMESEMWTSPLYSPTTGELLREARVMRYSGKDLVSDEVNVLGEVPVVHIANYPLAGEYWGMSDLTDAVDLNREINEKTTDISDIINYHGSPMTVLYGAKLTDLERGANRIWALPEGAKAENLTLSGDLSAASNHLAMLKATMLELTGTPEQALGKSMSISNASGVAIQMQFLPMLEKQKIKVLTYGHGIRLINRLFMRFMEIADAEFSSQMAKLSGNKYRNDVVFNDPLPQDEVRELEISRAKIDIGMSTRRKELERAGYSQREVEEILEEAKQEAEDEANAMFDTSPGRGKANLQRGGFNETRGEKIGQDSASSTGLEDSTEE